MRDLAGQPSLNVGNIHERFTHSLMGSEESAPLGSQLGSDVAPLNIVRKWWVTQKGQQSPGRLLRAEILLLPQGQFPINQENPGHSRPRDNRRLLKCAAVSPAFRIMPFQTATKSVASNLQIASIV